MQLKYNTLTLLITTVLSIISIWWIKSPFLGLLFFLAYLTVNSAQIGKLININERWEWRFFFGLITFSCLSTIILTTIYWFYQINTTVISIYLLLSFLITSIITSSQKDELKTEKNKNSPTDKHPPNTDWLLFLTIGVIDFTLFIALLTKNYGDTLISPWTIIGPRFFFLFLVSTAFLVWFTIQSQPTKPKLILLILKYVLTFSVTLIIFKHGFGFDQIIHQTTESWIAQHGSILPKQPYYLGQYVLIVFLALITHLPIQILDKVILPLGSAFALPLFIYYVFSRTGLNKKIVPALVLLPILPLSFFTFTTPFNLALFLALLLFFWVWYEIKNNNWHTTIFGLALVLSATCIHPLVGLPIGIIYLGSKLINQKFITKSIRPIVLILYFLLLTTAVPLILFLNAKRSDANFSWQNPSENLTYFTRIFASPYWYWFDGAPIFWRFLYYYKLALIPLILALIFVGMFIYAKKINKKFVIFNLVSTIALFASSFVVATAIRLPQVISYEQSDYALRLLKITLLLLLPFFLFFWQNYFQWLEKKKIIIYILTVIIGSTILLISFYFTYPTRDPVSRYTGFVIRDADLVAVQFIENKNTPNSHYLVLTNQTVASAALQKFGFGRYLNTQNGEQYFYSIPTGGPLYQYFRKMVYEHPKREWMEQAMEFANVKKAYFIHTNYWAPAAIIRDEAKLEADNWWELENGQVWIFEYLKK